MRPIGLGYARNRCPLVLIATDAEGRKHAMIVHKGKVLDCNSEGRFRYYSIPFKDAISDCVAQRKNPTYASRGEALDRLKREL